MDSKVRRVRKVSSLRTSLMGRLDTASRHLGWMRSVMGANAVWRAKHNGRVMPESDGATLAEMIKACDDMSKYFNAARMELESDIVRFHGVDTLCALLASIGRSESDIAFYRDLYVSVKGAE